jgi:pilus assembly protein CpaB
MVSLGASAVLGLGALFVAKAVLPNAATARQAAGLSAPASAGTPIVVATKDIKYGDKLDASMLAIARVPAEVAPQGAFPNVAQVLSQDHGGPPVAIQAIAAHEVVLPAKLSGPGARPSMAAGIEEGKRAYTIKVTDVSGVGGHALPGDRVDVVLMRDLTPSAPNRTWVADVVLQDVRLLGIDLNADLTSNKPAEPKNATLEVSVEDAQKLSIASTLGSLSLALRRTGAAQPEPVRTIAARDFLSGGGGAPVAAAVRPRSSYVRSGPPMIAILEYGGRVSTPPPAAAPAPAKAEPAPLTEPSKSDSFISKGGA